MSIICEFCKAELTTAYSLNRHKKINKKCLSIQFPETDATSIENEFLIPCDYCKVNISKYGLPKHMERCKKRFRLNEEKDSDNTISEISEDNENNELEKKYIELQDRYKELKKKYETLEDEFKFSQQQYKTYYDAFDEVDDLYIDLKEKHSNTEKELTYYKLLAGPNVFIYRQL